MQHAVMQAVLQARHETAAVAEAVHRYLHLHQHPGLVRIWQQHQQAAQMGSTAAHARQHLAQAAPPSPAELQPKQLQRVQAVVSALQPQQNSILAPATPPAPAQAAAMSPTAIKQGQPSAAQHAEMSNVPNFTSVFVQNLYGRYLALLKKLRPPYIPADPNNHRHLFLSQLESELRVQDRALEEHLAKVTGSMSRSGASDLVGARKLVFAWSARLAHVLDQELVKAMKVLAPGAKVGAGLDPEATSEPQPVTQSEDGVAAVKEKGKEEVRQASSHAVLWPVVAQLGAPGLALVAVQAVLNATLSGSHSMAAGRGEDHIAGGRPTSWVSQAIGLAVEDAIRLSQLDRELRQERAKLGALRRRGSKGREGGGDAQGAMTQDMIQGRGRVVKMAMLLDDLLTTSRLKRQATPIPTQAVHVMRRTIDRLLHKHRWSREQAVQVGAELLHLLLPLTRMPAPGELEGAMMMAAGQQPPGNDSDSNSKGSTSSTASATRAPVATFRLTGPTAFRHEIAYQNIETEGGGGGDNNKTRKVGVVAAERVLINYLLSQDDPTKLRALVDPRYLPMLVRPLPWTHLRSGGLLAGDVSVVRKEHPKHRALLQKAHAEGKLTRLYQALNIVSSTAWAINSRVLAVMDQLWRSSPEGDTVGLPSKLLPELPTPPGARQQAGETSGSSRGPRAAPSTPYLRLTREGRAGGQLLATAGPMTPGEEERYTRAFRRARQMRSNAESLITDIELRLSLARDLAGRQEFYLPHNIDFRGRAYPIPPYLHHLGDDMSKGLLRFAEGKPLGKHGLNWLLIQLANCYGQGLDKAPLSIRLQFGEGCLARCLATSSDPLSGEGAWWQAGEDPWRLLATALEVAAAVTSGDPTTFVSHLPVHQDGSCNGLQHYAALARDEGGARAVNLVPSDRPQDVYAAVAAEVNKRVHADAAAGLSEAVKLLARNQGQVDRKLVKQTVMTSVYGVTYVGAREQIAKRLEDRHWQNPAEVFQVSKYVAGLTLDSIASLYTNAQQVMSWLAESAQLVAGSNQPVIWTSPMGFPCMQPYYNDDTYFVVRSSLQNIRVAHPNDSQAQVNKRKQRTAFPPNYIHCLDSTHMLMTVEACAAEGITFAGVHDSYWTHACHVDRMGELLREKFIALHSQPLLENLHQELSRQATKPLDPVPPKGNLDLDVVRRSLYFFC